MNEDDPFVWFGRWYHEAVQSELDPSAFALATVDRSGRPSVRHVLLKEMEASSGLKFFTNYRSRKGMNLAERPFATACFLWKALQRQVIVEGLVRRVSDDESDSYFASRPRGSQIGAWASRQGADLSTRDELEARVRDYEAYFARREVSRPPYWGGFVIIPDRFEFWQGLPSRLHDRAEFRRHGGVWTRQRLSP